VGCREECLEECPREEVGWREGLVRDCQLAWVEVVWEEVAWVVVAGVSRDSSLGKEASGSNRDSMVLREDSTEVQVDLVVWEA